MIIGEIRRYLRDNNPIRVSRSLKDIAYKALQVREKLIRTNSKGTYNIRNSKRTRHGGRICSYGS